MVKKLTYYALLAVFILKTDKVVPIYRKPISGLDPMTVFRSPQSLTELLHEGLIETESLTASENLEQVSIVLNSLNDTYDRMIDSSKIHAVYRDDRDFLQNLIDRIDSMIQELEHSRHVSQESLDLLHENANLLHVLRAKMIG